MTGIRPISDFTGTPDSVPAIPQQGGIRPISDFMDENGAVPPQGFVDWGKNFIVNGSAMYLALTTAETDESQLLFTSGFEQRVKAARDALANTNNSTRETLNDFIHFFGQTFKDTAGQVKAIVDSPGQFVEGIKSDPWGAAGGLARGFLEPFTDAVEARYGVMLTEEDGVIRPLTADERLAKTKNAIAGGVMVAAEIGMLRALNPALRSVDELSAAKLMAETTAKYTKGKIVKDLTKNVIAAGVSGSAYGLVRYANEEDQISEMIINGVLFAPLGAAIDIAQIGGRKATLELRKAQAARVANMRQAQAIAQQSVSDGVKMLEQFKTADDIVDALVNKSVVLDKSDMTLIRGVSPAKWSTITKNPELTAISFQDVAGNFDILIGREVGSNVGNEATKFFRKTGFLPNQLVSYNGRGEYRLLEIKDSQTVFTTPPKAVALAEIANNPNLTAVEKAQKILAIKAGKQPIPTKPSLGDAVIQDLKTGKLLKVNHQTISHLTRVEMGNPIANIETNVRLKQRVLREVDARKNSYGADELPLDKENKAILSAAKTGQPISVVGFRFNRGVLIPGSPRFYADTYSGAASYKPSRKGLGRSSKIMTSQDALQYLNVHRLNFENPLVLRDSGQPYGSHESMIKYIKDNRALLGVSDKVVAGLDGAMKLRGNTRFNETGWPILDREIKRIIGGAGFDGIITSHEILDLRGTAAIDKPEPTKVSVLRFAPAVQSHFVKRLYTNWRDTFVSPRVDVEGIVVDISDDMDNIGAYKDRELKKVEEHLTKTITEDSITQVGDPFIRIRDAIRKELTDRKLLSTVEGRIEMRKKHQERNIVKAEGDLTIAKDNLEDELANANYYTNHLKNEVKRYEDILIYNKQKAKILEMNDAELDSYITVRKKEIDKLHEDLDQLNDGAVISSTEQGELLRVADLRDAAETEQFSRLSDKDALNPATIKLKERQHQIGNLYFEKSIEFDSTPISQRPKLAPELEGLAIKNQIVQKSTLQLNQTISQYEKILGQGLLDASADAAALGYSKQGLEDRLAIMKEELRIRNEEDILHTVDTIETDPDPGANFNFNKSIAEFAQARGFTADEIPLLKREFEGQLWTEFGNGEVDADDIAILTGVRDRLSEDIKVASQAAYDAKLYSSKQLAKAANGNGMYVDWEDAGRVTLRDMETGTVMFTTNKYNEAREFIIGSAQKNGVDLGSDFGVPPTNGDLYSATSGDPPDPMPSVFGPSTKMRDVLDSLNLMLSFAVPHRQIALSFDGLYKTQVLARVFAPLQEVKKKVNALVRPWYDKLIKTEELVLGMTDVDRERIGFYIETMSPDEVANKFMSRKMTDVEKHWGQRLSDMDIDMGRVFEYRRAIKNLLKDIDATQDPDLTNNFRAKIDEAKAAFGIDDNHQQAADLFGEILLMNRSEASLGAITRYARSLKGDGVKPEMTRAEFAKEHGLTPKQIQTAERLEAMYKELAVEFDIPDTRQLNGYMTHARLYTGGFVDKALDHFSGDTKVRDFYAKMARTGEISAYEKDPIRAMQRYIKAGYDALHLNAAVSNAKSALREEVKKIGGARGAKMATTMTNYIDEIQGHPGMSEKVTQEVVDDLLVKFNIQTSLDIRKKLVNNILSVFEAGAQGAKIAAGLRDWTFGMALTYSRFGAAITKDVMEFGIRGLDGMKGEQLERLGIINVANPVTFSDPVDAASTQIGRTMSKLTKRLGQTNQVLFKLSGQKDVYRWMHTGVYLAIFKRTGAELKLLRDKKISPDEFRRRIKLGTYQEGIIREFENLMKVGNDETTARFLATQTGYELVGYYGIANHAPMFRSSLGKLAGQFGGWSLWYVGILQQMLSRGTMMQRIGAGTRFGIAHATVLGVLSAAGFDAGSWNPIGGLFFAGGPLIDVWQSVSDASSGYGYKQREGRARLRRYLPYDPVAGRWNLQQLYIPGSSGVANIVRAVDAYQRGHNPIAVTGQASGIRIDESERSKLDRMIGNRPRLQRR